VKVGVVAIQGDFERHIDSVISAGATAREVKVPEDLEGVDRVIIPGGESTTVGLLMQRFGLDLALKARVSKGMPIWGTCMGMIMMARAVENRPDQFTLDMLDITVRRNAFGRQIHSFEAELPMVGFEEPINAVFIRAPVVTQVGPSVEVLATVQDQIVAVREGKRFGTSFHPELTSDLRLHEWFLTL
jgi:5'-phosphate synthase pdxT subunit